MLPAKRLAARREPVLYGCAAVAGVVGVPRVVSSRDWSRLSSQVVPGVDHLHACFRSRRYERHAHDDVVVIGFIERGVQASSYARGFFRAGSGSVVVIGRGIAHDGVPSDASGYEYRSLHVAHDLARDLLEDIAEVSGGRRRRRSDELVLIDPVLPYADLARMVRRFCRVATDPASGLPDREAALLETFRSLARAASFEIPDDVASKSESALVRAARDYIHAHLNDERLSISHIAQQCQTTRSHLTRCFRDAIGLPPHAYINLQRVQSARLLIARGEPPARVATALGFTDQSHLIRRFKGVYGITPGQFLKARA